MAFSVPSAYSPRRMTHVVPGTSRRIMTDRDAPTFPDLFCSKCIKSKLIVDAHGFCKVCGDFLCIKCAKQHEDTLMTLNHGLVVGEEFIEKYRHAMRKDKPQVHSRRSNLSMVATGRASIDYINQSENRQSVINSVSGYVKKSSDLKVHVSTDYRNCFICACVVLADGCIILADANNKKLKMFDKNFICLSVFQMKKEPWDLSAFLDEDSMFFVTEAHVKGVHQFKADCHEVQYIMTIKVEGECFGVTALKNECIAVSIKLKAHYEIWLLDMFGNILRKITGKGLRIRAPWYLCSINHGKNIVISDVEACSVSCIDVEGNVKFVVKKRQEMSDPRNITADRFDNIFVVDYQTDTVRQISPSGEDLGVILCAKNGLSSPCGLACYDGLLLIQAKMDSKTMQTFLLA